MALQPLAPLAPLSQHTYHPALLSTGNPGSGDPGSGTDTQGQTTYGPPQQGPGPGGGTDSGGGGGTTPGTSSASTSGCVIWNISTWTTSCILRLVLFILGLILIGGGVYMLKPAIVEKPLKAITKAAAIAA